MDWRSAEREGGRVDSRSANLDLGRGIAAAEGIERTVELLVSPPPAEVGLPPIDALGIALPLITFPLLSSSLCVIPFTLAVISCMSLIMLVVSLLVTVALVARVAGVRGRRRVEGEAGIEVECWILRKSGEEGDEGRPKDCSCCVRVEREREEEEERGARYAGEET